MEQPPVSSHELTYDATYHAVREQGHTKTHKHQACAAVIRCLAHLVKLPPFCTIKYCVRTVNTITPRNMGFFNPFTMFQLLVIERELNSLKICAQTSGVAEEVSP